MKKILFVYLAIAFMPTLYSASADVTQKSTTPATIRIKNRDEQFEVISNLALLSIKMNNFLQEQDRKIILAKKHNNLDLLLKRESLYPFFLTKKAKIDDILRAFDSVSRTDPLIIPTEILERALAQSKSLLDSLIRKEKVLLEEEALLCLLKEISQINEAIKQIAIAPR